ncbi:MAG: ATP-binding protein, partial [Deltaproteobacteria bacterium]|nr:ATP-binding protein [Deltaproteobacteria bacterium]
MNRPCAIHHCTPNPLRFFGRCAELALLDHALAGDEPSVLAMIGPGGQGKTAIVQHWLSRLQPCEGVFLWSFYRGKDSDLCLREMLAYAQGLDSPPDVSASYCVDKLLPIMRRERWALVLDGAEVVQHEQGAWFGRFVH